MKQLLEQTKEWNLPNCRVKVSDVDTQKWAKFIVNNLTAKNKEYLLSVLPIMISLKGWMHEDVAILFEVVIEDRTKSLIKAIESNKCESRSIPALSYRRERYAVGATILELINAGESNEFIEELKSKVEIFLIKP
ncbi:conserved hypothetical protein [Vibrio chagasii]|nr:conserved hypothetical protein [Vibrio chagasii]